MSEGNNYDPTQLAASQLGAMAMYGPAVANVFKNDFLPLQADAARWNTKAVQQYAPVLNRVGRNIANENQQVQAGLDNSLLQQGLQTGGVVDNLVEAQNRIEPEYFQGRGLALQGLQDLFKPMSGAEQVEMERGLNRMNGSTGNIIPDALTTASNAMQFGQAGRNRLSQAVAQATAALPTFRTGIDPYKVATGKSSSTSFGQPVSTDTSNNFGNQVFGQYGQQGMNSQNNTQASKSPILEQLPSYS